MLEGEVLVKVTIHYNNDIFITNIKLITATHFNQKYG